MFEKIKTTINAFAKKAAVKLSAASEKYSLKQKKMALMFFCLLCILFCTFGVIQTFTKTTHFKFKPEPIQLLPHIGKSFSVPESFISKETFDRVEYFKNHIDSATLLTRPGLMDSIALFEKIYLSQSKK
jgi:hypothetical protein